MKPSIIFCSQFNQKYTTRDTPDTTQESATPYTGKRRGRKPGSKKISEDTQTRFKIENKEITLNFS